MYYIIIQFIMEHINEQKKIAALEKIRKLLMVTAENGSSESEVEQALKAIQRISMQYEIDQDEYTLSPLDIQIDNLQNEFKSYEYRYWYFDTLAVICRAYSCRVIKKWVPVTGSYYRIIGTNADRNIVKNAFETIVPIIRNIETTRWKVVVRAQEEYLKTLDLTFKQVSLATLIKRGYCVSRKVHFNSYYQGFIRGLSQKLASDKEDFLQLDENREKWELIVVTKDALIEEIIKEEFPKLKMHKTKTKIDRDTYFKGKKDGEDTDMSTKLGESY